ncbi:DUF6382 domain-containing protein [Bacillus sp. 3255]|uniref:DUF6382 domain-containing protein n=1 Tax=Bacillus sp. 3255 TaxID=2817904 RepID=UPI002854371E|nr:DUF6382 domain-containing protein [Bacillus sp. 3255]MDR6882311.1 hypothetical protein [Bacillus sp. 3255]
MKELFGLRSEFVYLHGHYLRLYKEGESSLTEKELSALQVKMLEANTIPNLLPLEIHEVDFRISLMYKLGAKRMLGHVLKVEGLTFAHFAKLVYTVFSAIEGSKNYMLHESGFVLKENFIFIGSDWMDVYLTYVPLDMNRMEEERYTSFFHFMKQMAMELNDVERHEAEAWLDTLPPEMEPKLYKEKLLNLMNEHNRRQINKLPPPIRQRSEKSESAPLNGSFKEPEAMMPIVSERLLAERYGYRIAFTPVRTRTQWLVLTGVILAAAFTWRHYVDSPSTSSLHLSAGLTVLFTDLWFIVKFLGVPAYRTIEESRTSQEPEKPPAEPPDLEAHYQNLHMHTTLLRQKQSEATVFLGSIINKSPGPRLEWEDLTGEKNFISLRNESFSIGRGDDNHSMDYVLEEAGVSRIHAEIRRNGQGYEVQDTGSTNGTSLNGEPMVANRPYPLIDGDEIRIVRRTFIFRSS